MLDKYLFEELLDFEQHRTLSPAQVQIYLQRYLAEFVAAVDDLRLYEADNGLEIELILLREILTDTQIEQIKQCCEKMRTEVNGIANIFLFFRV